MSMTGPQPLDTRDSTLNVALGDRYSIERELGRGGMGTVYLAEERKHARKVAIKVLRLEPGATPGSDRFLREIGIAARLSHPYIVPLIDSGEAAGFLYYVAAYVPGGTLRDRLRREGGCRLRTACESHRRSPRRSTTPIGTGSCTAM